MSLPVRTRTAPLDVGDVGAWKNAAAVVEESDRNRVEEIRKRMKEDEEKGVVPAPRTFNEKWKKVGLGEGPREIVGVERPQAAAAAKPILPHLRRPT